jgi:hypothetical protein
MTHDRDRFVHCPGRWKITGAVPGGGVQSCDPGSGTRQERLRQAGIAGALLPGFGGSPGKWVTANPGAHPAVGTGRPRPGGLRPHQARGFG